MPKTLAPNAADSIFRWMLASLILTALIALLPLEGYLFQGWPQDHLNALAIATLASWLPIDIALGRLSPNYGIIERLDQQAESPTQSGLRSPTERAFVLSRRSGLWAPAWR